MQLGQREFAPFQYRPGLEQLEERSLLASYTLTPVIPTLDAVMVARLSAVLQRGVSLGNQANVFSRAGDSITYSNNFLVPLGKPSVGVDRSGDGSLSDTLAYFRAAQVGATNSFINPSEAALGGWTSADVLARLPSELASSRPAYVLIMVGTNDVSEGVPLDTFRQNLTAIVQTALDAGVVPVLSTIPDNKLFAEGEARQPAYNQVIEDVGESLQVPVWNYWRALQNLPNAGISADGIHPTVSPNGGGDLSVTGLSFGYNVRNLTALQTLDKLRRVLVLGQPPDLPNQNASWVPLTNAVAVASGDATGFQVQLLDMSTRKALVGVNAFPGYLGSVRVAMGDVNRDGVPDLIVTAGPGGPPHVKVFDGQTGELYASFLAFEPTMTAGLSVAVGDVDGDGAADIIVTPEGGGPAHVKAFTGTGELVRSFIAFNGRFLGGARVASADLNRDGFADIVVSAGTGGHGHTVVYSGADGQLLASFLPFGPLFGGRVSVAAGDFSGTGQGELAIGVAFGAASHVEIYRPLTGTRVASYFAYSAGFLGGIRLGTVTRGGRTYLMTVSNTAGLAGLRRFDALSGALRDQFFLYEAGFSRGPTFGG